ncbi:hypothetical protein BDN72DRAFT_847794 [Pluteus cervinus]|uniref:Uncharacterized protein n=1 Tax=Pluteus cervinus TaxID=181527 RepID=A0ACD3ACC0_9AGAR|nr:hypothetical protein BDN72DRAFT_847794 [Pluteus cervinus]
MHHPSKAVWRHFIGSPGDTTGRRRKRDHLKTFLELPVLSDKAHDHGAEKASVPVAISGRKFSISRRRVLMLNAVNCRAVPPQGSNQSVDTPQYSIGRL